MQDIRQDAPVAHTHRWLYVYAATMMVLTCVGILRLLITAPHPSPYFTSAELRQLNIISAAITFGFNLTVLLYLMLSRNLKRILWVLEILIVLGVLGLFLIALRPNTYSVVVSLVHIFITLALFIYLYRQPASEAVIVHEVTKSNTRPKRSVRRILLTIVKVIVRYSIASYGFVLAITGLLMMQQSLTRALQYGIPLLAVGFIYMAPYYLLKKPKHRLIFGSIALLVTTIVLVCLQLSLRADMATKQAFFSDNQYQFSPFGFIVYYSTFALAFYTIVLLLDVLAPLFKTKREKWSLAAIAIPLAFIAMIVMAAYIPSPSNDSALHQGAPQLHDSSTTTTHATAQSSSDLSGSYTDQPAYSVQVTPTPAQPTITISNNGSGNTSSAH